MHSSTGAAPPDVSALLEITLVDLCDKTIEHRGHRQRITTGVVGVRSPFEAGRLVRRHLDETRVRLLSVADSEMAEACAAAGIRGRDLPSVLRYAMNPPLFRATASVFAAVETGAGALEVQTKLAACAARVVETLSGQPPTEIRAPEAPVSARRIRDILHDRITEDLSLEELAREVSLSRTYVVHAFRHAYGLSPFEYLMHVRVAHARRLLATGGRPVDVAHACGFCDQSHLNRWFRKATGVTPGSYALACGPATQVDEPSEV